MTQPLLSSIKVRMYYTGFGDCLLLTFGYTDLSNKTMWIDFGARGGKKARMQAIANDIKQYLINLNAKPHIDVLAITHEHQDHISGFEQAKNELADLTIGQLWLAWTEDPTHPLAKAWRQTKKKTRQALSMAVREFAGVTNSPNGIADRLRGIMGFEVDDELLTGTDSINFDVNRIYEDLIKQANGNVRYPRPGHLDDQQHTQPGQIIDNQTPNYFSFGGIRIYVLGPPENLQAIKAVDPDADKWQTSLLPDYLSGEFSFSQSQALLEADGKSRDFWQYVRKAPFDEEFVLPIDLKTGEMPPEAFQSESERPTPVSGRVNDNFTKLKQTKAYKAYFGIPETTTDQQSTDAKPVENSRQINYDYLLSADSLAIKLNANVNNTSLVLAFELEQTGDVLFFSGDAESGVWQAWHDDRDITNRLFSWNLTQDGKPRQVTVEDLMAASVLYKVGHHGSHNATPKTRGIDKLSHPDLTALVPVDHDVATRYGWDGIPFKELFDTFDSRKIDYARADQLSTDPILNKIPLPNDKTLRSKAAISWGTDKDLYFDWTIALPPSV